MSLRYHIVTITAVFLALAIGIAVGTTVIDKATVDTLESQLDDLEARINDTEEQNSRLNDELNDTHDVLQQLAEQGGRLFQGELVGVPVVFVAPRGIDQDSLGGARQAVIDAGAAYGGTLWLTDRLVLDDEGEIDNLAELLGSRSRDPAHLQQRVASALARVVLDASVVPETGVDDPAPDGTTTSEPAEPTESSSTEPSDPGAGEDEASGPLAEPDFLRALRSAGFVEFEPAEGASEEAVVLLPGLRVAVVSGAGADLADGSVLLPMLAAVAEEGLSPVVAASAAVGTDAEEREQTRATFVGAIRTDDLLRERVSTVDDLETFAGRAGLVLAIDLLGTEVRGHYGVGEGAERLLPPPAE